MTEGKRAVGQQFKANCWGKGGWAGGRQQGKCKEKVERSSHCAFCQEMVEAGLGRTQMKLGLSQGCPPWWVSLSCWIPLPESWKPERRPSPTAWEAKALSEGVPSSPIPSSLLFPLSQVPRVSAPTKWGWHWR